MTHSYEFFFRDGAAGYFEQGVSPTRGRNRYMPYRSLGHLQFVQAVRSSGDQQCYCMVNGEKHFFVVRSIPESHVLDVA